MTSPFQFINLTNATAANSSTSIPQIAAQSLAMPIFFTGLTAAITIAVSMYTKRADIGTFAGLFASIFFVFLDFNSLLATAINAGTVLVMAGIFTIAFIEHAIKK